MDISLSLSFDPDFYCGQTLLPPFMFIISTITSAFSFVRLKRRRRRKTNSIFSFFLSFSLSIYLFVFVFFYFYFILKVAPEFFELPEFRSCPLPFSHVSRNCGIISSINITT